MVDLVDFVLARIAEREALALAASEDDVQWADGWSGRLRWSMPGDVADDNLYDLYLAMPPELVLAECEAKRRIMEAHAPELGTVEWPHDQTGKGQAWVCRGCANRDLDGWIDWRPAMGEAGVLPEGVVPPYVLAPCSTLRLLALPHADHPDYRQEWGAVTEPGPQLRKLDGGLRRWEARVPAGQFTRRFWTASGATRWLRRHGWTGQP